MNLEDFEYYNFSDYSLKFFDGKFHVYDDDINWLASFEFNCNDALLIAKMYGIVSKGDKDENK